MAVKTIYVQISEVGQPGVDGRNVELQKSATHIQWRYSGEIPWHDLVALSDLTGANGTDGTNGSNGTNGVDGREILLRVDSGYIQWKYDSDIVWNNLIALLDLKGDKGDQGDPGPKGDKGDKGDIGVSGSSNWNDLLDGPSSTPAAIDASVADQDRLSNVMSSSLISGGIITINALDNTKIDITSGSGVIVNNYTDPLHPTRSLVSWSEKIGVSDIFISASNNSAVYIDLNGDVQFYATDVATPEQRRDIIYLGWTSHLDFATLDDVGIEPYAGQDIYNNLVDFFEAFGSFNIIGNDYSFADANLTILKSAGKTFDACSNYVNSKKSPNIYDSDLFSPVEFYYYNRDGDGNWVDNNPLATNIDPNHYDTPTGLVDVTTGYWTIQPIFFYAQYGSTDIQYGQVEYSSFEEAKSAITAPVDYDPYVADYDTFRAWLVIQQGCTDLSDDSKAIFILAGKLGLVTEASGGGQGGEINTASNIGLSGIGLWKQKVGVDLQFKNLAPGSSVITITDDAINNLVKIDVAQDETHRFVTDIEKSAWDAKQAALGFTPEDSSNKLSAFQVTPDDTHYVSEKLTKDSLNGKVDKITGSSLVDDDLISEIHAPHSDDQDLSGLVPNTRKINGHDLSSDVTVTAGDIGLGTNDTPSFAGLTVTGSINEAVVSTAINITLNATNRIIFCLSELNISLPTANGIIGRAYNIINTGIGSILIIPYSIETINGEENLILSSQYDSVVLMSDGINWIRVS